MADHREWVHLSQASNSVLAFAEARPAADHGKSLDLAGGRDSTIGLRLWRGFSRVRHPTNTPTKLRIARRISDFLVLPPAAQ
jgi:hypothetical protein